MNIGILTIVSPMEKPYLREWVCYHRDIGIQQFWLVIDADDDRQMEGLTSVLSDVSGVDIQTIQASALFGRSLDYRNTAWQCLAYNQAIWDWMFPNPHCPDRLFVIDVDEFVKIRPCEFLGRCRTLPEILWDNPHDIALNWRLYGSNGETEVKNGNYSVLGRFTRCSSSLNLHVKVCLDLKDDHLFRFFTSPHCLNCHVHDLQGNDVYGPFNERPREFVDELEIAHYATKSMQECRERRSFRRADTGIPREEGCEAFFKEHDVNEIDEGTLYE